MSAAIVLIAAVARNGVIGRDNRLLWRLRSDLQRFKSLTLGKPVIMGRKTFESIGRPLPGRTTIVVTRSGDFSPPPGVLVARTMQDALALARQEAVRLGSPDIMVAGGGEIYAQFLPLADRLELTWVELEPEGDVHFPPLPDGVWRESRRESHDSGPQDEASFAFVTYERVERRGTAGLVRGPA